MQKQNVNKAIIVCGLALGAGVVTTTGIAETGITAKAVDILEAPTVVADITTPTYNNVRLTMTNPNEVGDIHYSFDNGATWKVYSKPVEVTKNGTISVRVNNGSSYSTTVAFPVENLLKLEKPTIVTDITEDTYKKVTVSLNNPNTDGLLKYSLDNGTTWNTYTTPFEVDKNVNVTAKVETTDNTSDLEMLLINNIKVVLAPTVESQTLEDGSVNVSISHTNTEGELKYSTDNGVTWKNYTEVLNINETTTIKTKVVIDGRESPQSSFVVTIASSLKNPVVTSENLSDGRVEVTITNPNNKGYIYYKLNNGSWINYSQKIILTESADIIAKAVFNGKESGETSYKANVNVVLTSPTITSTQKTDGTVDVIMANPNKNGVIYYKTDDSTEWVKYTKAVNVSKTTKFTAKVSYDNKDSEESTYTVTKNSVLKSPTFKTENKPDGTIDVTVENIGTEGEIYVKKGTGEYEKYTGTFNVTESTDIKAKVKKDTEESLESTIKLTITKNLTSPSVTAKKESNGSVTIEITNPNSTGTVKYRTASGRWVDYTEPINYTSSTTLRTKIVDGTKESPETNYVIDVNKVLVAPKFTANKNVDGTVAVEMKNTNTEGKMYYQIDDGEWVEYRNSILLTKTSKLSAKVVSDKLESPIATTNYTLENTSQICNCLPPKIQLSTEQKDVESLLVFLMSQDNSNNDLKFYYKLGATGSWTRQENLLGIKLDENVVVYAKTVDANGLSSELTSREITNIKEKTTEEDTTKLEKPTITKSKLDNNAVTIKIASTVENGVIEYRVDNGDWKIYSKEFAVNGNVVIQSRVSKDNKYSEVETLTVDDFKETDDNYTPEIKLPSTVEEIDVDSVIKDTTVIDELFLITKIVNLEKTAVSVKAEPLYDTNIHAIVYAKGKNLTPEEVLEQGKFTESDSFLVTENGDYTVIIVNEDGESYLTSVTVEGIEKASNNTDNNIDLGIDTDNNNNDTSGDNNTTGSGNNTDTDNNNNNTDNNTDTNSNTNTTDNGNNSDNNSDTVSEDVDTSEDLPQTGYNEEANTTTGILGLFALMLGMLGIGSQRRKQKNKA